MGQVSDARQPRLYATRGQLALAFLLMALLVLGGGTWPLRPDAPVALWFGVSGWLAALAGLTMLLPARPWVMPATLGGGMVGGGVLLASCLTAEALVVLSLGVITAAQFAAYAFRRGEATVLLALALGVITVGMLLAPAPFHAMTWIVVLLMTVVSTCLLGYVTHWLRRQATTDDLTGALARGALLERLDAELREAQRTGAPLTVVSADIDDFKTINDTRGHLAGDEALESLVVAWQVALGRRACVGRVGGDEFVIVLPDRNHAEAARWIATVRERTTVAWSAGVATAGSADTTRDLLARADVALYTAKAGRASRPASTV